MRFGSPLLALLGVLALNAPGSASAETEAAASELPAAASGPSADAAPDADTGAGAQAWPRCAICHGTDGAGRSDGTFPRLAGQHASVVVKQLQDMREGRRGNPVMMNHLRTLTDPREIADLASYIEAMPPPPKVETQARPATERGAALYAKDCARCHGPSGGGNAEARVPVIAGQNDEYLLRQLRAIAGSLRRNAHPGMLDMVFDYRDEDMREVIAYVSNLPWPEPETLGGP